MILERGRATDTNGKNYDRISDIKNDDLDMTGESVCVLALFGGARSHGSKCGLSFWYVGHLASLVATGIVASQSNQMTERLIKSTPFSYTAGC